MAEGTTGTNWRDKYKPAGRGGAVKRNSIDSVCLAIDVSPRMNYDNKLAYAKRGAIDFAADAIEKGFNVGVVSFGNYSQAHISPSQNLKDIKAVINSLTIHDYHCNRMENGIDMAIQELTKMQMGIETAVEQLEHTLMQQAICIVSDGKVDSPAYTLQAANNAKSKGIAILTLGTEDADKEFLDKLASAADLSKIVSSSELESGIRSMAGLLPSSSD